MQGRHWKERPGMVVGMGGAHRGRSSLEETRRMRGQVPSLNRRAGVKNSIWEISEPCIETAFEAVEHSGLQSLALE